MEKIPSKHQERKDDHRRKKSPTVSLPPLTPTNNRQNPKNPPWTTSRGPPYVSRNSQRPYRVLHIGATPLMHACQQADRSRVLRLLKEQEETIGYRDRTLRSALHYCMDAGTGGAVASAAPELVNAPDAEGHTPLHLAVIAGDTQLVAVLLANGADVTAKDLEGHGVVHWATVCGEAECVRLVLAAGARPSTPDLRGGSPLHYAAQCCGAAAQLSVPKKVGLNVLETLVEFGADVNAKDEDGRQPILWAASAGSVEAVLALARAGGSAAAGATDKDGLTALHCAASRGQTRCVEALVNLCGCHPDHVDDNGCSALHYAATLGHADATALLLRLGADPNRQDRKGRTPALCAAAKGQLETLKILAEHGGSLHARTVRGTGVAHEAVLSGRTELVEWLAKKRPSTLDVATHDGKTPLHVAALHGYLDVCKLLLDHGARINAVLRTSKSGPMTALDAALYRGHRDCAKLVQMHGGTSAQRLKTLRDNQVFTSGKLERGETSDDLERWIDERRRSRKSICREELSRRRAAAAAAAAAASADGGGGGGGRRRARSEQRSGVCWKKFDKIESWSETNEYSDEKKERVKKFSRKAVRGDKLISDDSLSDDSLEVVVVKKSLEKTSGRIKTRSKVPRETWRETRFTETRRRTRRSDNKKFSEEVADNKSEENKRERKFEKDATDYSTSEETAERVTVTALVHKDTRKDSSVRGGSSKDDLIGENMPRASEINESTEETRRETTGNDGTTSQIESQRDDDATSDKESKGERRNEKTSEGLVLTQQEGERSEKSEKSEKTDGSTAGNLLQSESLDSREEYKESGGPSDESSDKIDESIGKVGESVGKVGESVGKVGESVGKVGESVGKVGESVGKIDESVGKIGESVGKIDESVGKIDESIDKIDESIDKIDEKEEALEYKQPNDETIESDRSSRPTIEVSNKFDESSGSGEKSRGEKRGDESSREGSRSENRRRAESSEEGSPDRSAIVAVIEEWDEIPGGVSTSHSSLGAIGVNERRGGSREEGAKQRRDSGGRDSGIEPSPRVSRIPKRTAKYCPSTRIDMVTRDVQISLRRYHLERKIFFQLMELKRLQIRHGRANEHVLVKRQVETFHKAGMSGPALGVARYDQPLTFRHFEAFLYEQLRRLQRRPATPDFCTEAKQCTQKTHRCHHATSAYTSVPIYTYLDGRGQEREDCLLPRIESRGRAQMTVRVTRGEEKRVIALPADRTKRYYVTFTVRGEGNESSGGIEESRSNAQRNTKSV